MRKKYKRRLRKKLGKILKIYLYKLQSHLMRTPYQMIFKDKLIIKKNLKIVFNISQAITLHKNK
jgi:hypothetical protein